MAKRKILVLVSKQFNKDLTHIHEYGSETFGPNAADAFNDDIYDAISSLDLNFNMYPECRHIPTPENKYRNIILGKYIILYRIEESQIEVLRAFHSSRSPQTIRSAVKIKVKKRQ